jgi:peptide/nickel transport system substrate-binding protein
LSLSLGVAIAVASAVGGCDSCRTADQPARPLDAPAVLPSREWLEGKLPIEVGQGTPSSGGTLTVRLYAEPLGLNRLHDEQKEALMVRYTVGPIYETLFELDRDDHPRYRMKPLLAESYEDSPNRLTQTIRLRKGVRFHNGEPMTSRDVKAVMDALLNPNNPTHAFRSSFTDLGGYEAPDDYTFVIKWKRPYYRGFRTFATALPVMPASGLRGDFDGLAINRAPIGTGPFKFGSWEPNKVISMVRNEEYWGKKAYLDRLEFRIVKDDAVATQMFERGDFDIMVAIQPSVWRTLEKADAKNNWAVNGYNRIYFADYNYSWIGWNQERPFFSNAQVRTALGMLIPYDGILREIDLGLEIPTSCPFYLESPYCDPEVQRLVYNPEAAGRLLDEAGWIDSNGDGVRDKAGVPFKFTLTTRLYSVRLSKIAELLRDQFKKAGIEMDIERVDNATMKERRLKHQFDALAMNWSNQDTEDDLFELFHSSQFAAGNSISYRNQEVDRLIEESRAEFDFPRRVELNRKIHRILYQDQPYYFMSSHPMLDAVKKSVRGIKPSVAWYDFRRIWIQK